MRGTIGWMWMAAGCADGAGDGDGHTPPAEPSPLDGVIQALGGRAALEGMTGFTYRAEGLRYMWDEGVVPDSASQPNTNFEVVVSDDRLTDSVRWSWDRTDAAGNVLATYDETLVGQLGVVDGVDSGFGSTGDMPSSRWAAVRKQHRVLNPHLLVLDALSDPNLPVVGETAEVDDVVYDVTRIDDPLAPYELLVDPSSGNLERLRVLENDHLRRDVTLEVVFSRWKDQDGGVRFPNAADLFLDGEPVHTEERSNVQLNSDLPAARFAFPDGADPEYDADLALFGERSAQFHQMWAAFLLPLDLPQTGLDPQPIADGVIWVGGGSHNSMVVEQTNGIVVVEAPLYPERSEAILSWIADTFPGKPVTHVIVTHHHTDHAAGARAFAAAGAEVVVAEAGEALMARVLAAPSTVSPDTLSTDPVATSLVTVSYEGSLVLDDPERPVTAWHLDSGHATDSLVVQVNTPDDGQLVFQSDLFLPGGGGATFFAPWSQELRDLVETKIGGEPTHVGGHGSWGPHSELVNVTE